MTIFVVNYYFLDLRDTPVTENGSEPLDPAFGTVWMRVERGLDESQPNVLEDAYDFDVYTWRYLQERYIAQNRPLAGKAVIIVPTLESKSMTRFLDENVDSLPDWGVRTT